MTQEQEPPEQPMPAAGRDIARYLALDLREVGEAAVVGYSRADARLRRPDGRIRAGALLTLLDSVGGLCGGLAALPDGWVVSTNLSARILDAHAVGPLRLASEVLRTGRNNVVTSVDIRDEGDGDRLVLDGILTSAILVPENGPPLWQRPVVLRASEPDAPEVAIPDWLGVRAVDAATMEIELADRFRNPWGILHGGVVAMLVDLTAEHTAGAHGLAGPTTDTVLHFLAPNRVGPVRAHARFLGERSDGAVLRVEVRDEGAGRVTAVAIVTAGPGGGG